MSPLVRIRPLQRKISLNIRRPTTIYVRVRRFNNTVFALAAFLWLPVSVHCQLESIPGLEFLRCADETPSSQNPAEDCSNCCAVEKSQYRTKHVRLTIPTLDLLPLCFTPALSAADNLPVEVSLGILTAAPPQLRKTWQFASRTALPVRAPSLAS